MGLKGEGLYERLPGGRREKKTAFRVLSIGAGGDYTKEVAKRSDQALWPGREETVTPSVPPPVQQVDIGAGRQAGEGEKSRLRRRRGRSSTAIMRRRQLSPAPTLKQRLG